MTHAAFAVGLMRHCLVEGTPHPGFTIVDTPLTPFRGSYNDAEVDEAVRDDVHVGTLMDLASRTDGGQAVIVDNIDPPPALAERASVVVFTGPGGLGRSGFYPPLSLADSSNPLLRRIVARGCNPTARRQCVAVLTESHLTRA